MKLSTGVMKFAMSNMALFEAFQDYWNQYISNLPANDKLKKNVEYSKTLSFAEKEANLNAALRKEIVRRSGIPYAAETNVSEWFFHPLAKHETFALVGALIDMILPISIIDSIGAYTSVVNLGWGDTYVARIRPNNLFTVTKGGRGKRSPEVTKQFTGTKTINPEPHMIGVEVDLYNVLNGTESLAELTAKAIRSMETAMTLEAYASFAASFVALPSTTTTGLQVSGYSQASLIRICEQVTSWNQGAKAVILGTRLALANVLPDDANYRYMLDSQYVTLGYLQQIGGFDVLAIPQVADLTTPWGLALSNSYLWILSPMAQKLLTLVIEGTTLSFTDEPFDNADGTMISVLKKNWAVAVATNAIYGTIAL